MDVLVKMNNQFKELAGQLLAPYQHDDVQVESLAKNMRNSADFWFLCNRDDLKRTDQEGTNIG
jgi:hypothetical protein